jgi:hypothetical protein
MILDRENSMFKQLQLQKYTAASKHSVQTNDLYISTDEDEAAAEVWEPHPLENGQNNVISVRGRRNDQINTLIDIYGNQE